MSGSSEYHVRVSSDTVAPKVARQIVQLAIKRRESAKSGTGAHAGGTGTTRSTRKQRLQASADPSMRDSSARLFSRSSAASTLPHVPANTHKDRSQESVRSIFVAGGGDAETSMFDTSGSQLPHDSEASSLRRVAKRESQQHPDEDVFISKAQGAQESVQYVSPLEHSFIDRLEALRVSRLQFDKSCARSRSSTETSQRSSSQPPARKSLVLIENHGKVGDVSDHAESGAAVKAPLQLPLVSHSGSSANGTLSNDPLVMPSLIQADHVMSTTALNSMHNARPSHPSTLLPSPFDAMQRSKTTSGAITTVGSIERRKQTNLSGTTSPASSGRSGKRVPPTSFPVNFYDKLSDNEVYQPVEQAENLQLLARPQSASSGISPLSTPAPQEPAKPKDPDPTPHDKRGRPTFYSTIHYFTDCAHTCPPATRPLDPHSQPREDPNFHPTNPEIIRSIIPGSCYNCDTALRRQIESDIIDHYTKHVTRLTQRLRMLVELLESHDAATLGDEDVDGIPFPPAAPVNLTSPPTTPGDNRSAPSGYTQSLASTLPLSDSPTTPTLSSSSPSTSSSTINLYDPNITSTTPTSTASKLAAKISTLQWQIETAQRVQDNEVHTTWEGYTQRWGPGTLGILRGGSVTPSRNTSRASSMTRRSGEREREPRTPIATPSSSIVVGEARGVLSPQGSERGVRTGYFADSHVNGYDANAGQLISPPPSRPGVSRNRSSSTSRITISSYRSAMSGESHYEPGEGKMKVSWIRPERET